MQVKYSGEEGKGLELSKGDWAKLNRGLWSWIHREDQVWSDLDLLLQYLYKYTKTES